VCHLVMEVMQEFKDNDKIQLFGCSIIYLRVEFINQEGLGESACKFVMEAMERFKDNDEIQLFGRSIIYRRVELINQEGLGESACKFVMGLARCRCCSFGRRSWSVVF
jgi:hypothetical protein